MHIALIIFLALLAAGGLAWTVYLLFVARPRFKATLAQAQIDLAVIAHRSGVDPRLHIR